MLAGDLGEMGNTDDLVVICQGLELLPDHICGSPRDSGIHLIEDNRLHRGGFGQDDK